MPWTNIAFLNVQRFTCSDCNKLIKLNGLIYEQGYMYVCGVGEYAPDPFCPNPHPQPANPVKYKPYSHPK